MHVNTSCEQALVVLVGYCYSVTAARDSAAVCVQVSQELLQQIRETVLQRTVDGMKEEGTPYVGKCSFFGPFL